MGFMCFFLSRSFEMTARRRKEKKKRKWLVCLVLDRHMNVVKLSRFLSNGGMGWQREEAFGLVNGTE